MKVHLGAALLDRGLAVGVDDGVRDRPIFHDTPVDEQVLRTAGRSLFRQCHNVAEQLHVAAVATHFDRSLRSP